MGDMYFVQKISRTFFGSCFLSRVFFFWNFLIVFSTESLKVKKGSFLGILFEQTNNMVLVKCHLLTYLCKLIRVLQRSFSCWFPRFRTVNVAEGHERVGGFERFVESKRTSLGCLQDRVTYLEDHPRTDGYVVK